jgi:thiol:disulfide interchange protein DsbC
MSHKAGTIIFIWTAFIAVVCAAVLTSSPAHAADALRSAAFPRPKLKDFRWNDRLGLYEVVINGQVLYVSRNYRYLFVGKVIDIQTMSAIGGTRADSSWIMNFAALNPADAIKISSGSRSLAVFFDPECPFCKKELGELSTLRDVAVYIYLYPLTELHPSAKHAAGSIWCAKDRVRALFDLSARAKEPDCKTPVDRNTAFAAAHHIAGTPTIILDNGKALSGFIEAPVITHLMEREDQK